MHLTSLVHMDDHLGDNVTDDESWLSAESRYSPKVAFEMFRCARLAR